MCVIETPRAENARKEKRALKNKYIFWSGEAFVPPRCGPAGYTQCLEGCTAITISIISQHPLHGKTRFFAAGV